MTEALVQNSENITSTADILLNLKNGNLASRKTETDDSFSNLINTLDANTKKAQTDFVKKAIKSNTSSINKLAIKNDTQSAGSIKTPARSIKESNQQKDDLIDDRQNGSNDKNTTLNVQETSNDTTAGNAVEVSQERENIKPILDEEKKEEDLSDINNSSHVESSPVFSLDETNDNIQLDEQNKKDIKDVLSNVLISLGVDTAQNDDLNTEIDEILSKVETLEEIPNAIDEIFSSLDNLNLSKDNKNDLFQTFEQIKDIINNAVKKADDVDLKAEASEFLKEVISKAATEKENNLLQSVDLKNEIEIKSDNDKPFKDVSDETEKLAQDIKNTLKELKEAFEKKDFDKLEKISDDLDSLLKEVDNSKTNINSEIIDDLKEITSKVSEVLEFNNKDTDINLVDFNEISKDLENLADKFDKEFLKNTNEVKTESLVIEDNIQIQDNQDEKSSLNELLEVFKDFKNSSDYEKLSDEDKQKVDEYIDKIVDVQQETPKVNSNKTETEKNTVQETISKVQDFVNNNIDIPQDDEIKLNAKENVSDIHQETENTIDLSEVFKQARNSQDNENFSNQNKNASYDDFLKNNQTIEADFKSKDVEITQENVEESEINLQKEVFVDALQDDMLLDISFQDEVQSGALSVADEVAKMALNEQNSSLNATTTVHGAISYDNLAPELSMIKNAAQMMKAQNTTSQQIQNDIGGDIFNQITNKITQLKDAQGQKLTMVLRPHDLGRLSIELTTNHLGLTTNILAQNDDVRAYIEKNIDSLRQQLSDAGVNVNNIQIKTMGQEGSTNYQGNSQNFNSEQQNQDTNSQNQQKQNQQHQRENKEFLAGMSNYDLHFAKDFSSVLNKTISYNLN